MASVWSAVSVSTTDTSLRTTDTSLCTADRSLCTADTLLATASSSLSKSCTDSNRLSRSTLNVSSRAASASKSSWKAVMLHALPPLPLQGPLAVELSSARISTPLTNSPPSAQIVTVPSPSDSQRVAEASSPSEICWLDC